MSGDVPPLKQGKPFWLSKTYGANLLLASAVELSPRMGNWVVAHPQTSVLLITAMNIVLRAFTKDVLHYRGETES